MCSKNHSLRAISRDCVLTHYQGHAATGLPLVQADVITSIPRLSRPWKEESAKMDYRNSSKQHYRGIIHGATL
jgi:hypothetical protein